MDEEEKSRLRERIDHARLAYEIATGKISTPTFDRKLGNFIGGAELSDIDYFKQFILMMWSDAHLNNKTYESFFKRLERREAKLLSECPESSM